MFIRQFIVCFLGAMAGVILARVLGVEGKGAYALVLLVPKMAVTLGNLGIRGANIYFLGKKEKEERNIIANSLFLAFIIGLFIIFIIFIIFSPLRENFFSGVPQNYLYFGIFSIPFLLLSSYFNGVIIAKDLIKKLVVKDVVINVISLLLLGLTVWYFKLGLIAALVVWFIILVVDAFINFVFVNQASRKIKWRFSVPVFKESIVYGLKIYLGNLVQFLNYRLDMFLVSFFMGVRFVGFYSIAVSLAELIWYFPDSFATMLFPRVSSSSEKENNRFTPLVTRNVALLLLIEILFILVTGRFVVWLLYGEGFFPSLRPFYFLLPGVLILGFGKILSADLAGRGKPVINAYISIVALFINISLNIYLIPKMGMSGAALASTISYTVTGILTIIYFIKLTGCKLSKILFVQKEDFAYYRDFINKKLLKRGIKEL
ncbi:hypothetical protein COY23_02805 [bacterium (Candidatus Torokbacteria) CG_4_10_14_0_2_um_filter_35_8]|nr:MAG: hypothetical protein COY23_02805 [bacterium (Candidatus Torokbacteria) CG_4_10_14_0_2_um_filter_35_8]